MSNTVIQARGLVIFWLLTIVIILTVLGLALLLNHNLPQVGKGLGIIFFAGLFGVPAWYTVKYIQEVFLKIEPCE